MTFAIEKNIPFPEKYPFRVMEVGDSFLVPDKFEVYRLRSIMGHHHRNSGLRFTTRTVAEGIRVWRTQ